RGYKTHSKIARSSAEVGSARSESWAAPSNAGGRHLPNQRHVPPRPPFAGKYVGARQRRDGGGPRTAEHRPKQVSQGCKLAPSGLIIQCRRASSDAIEEVLWLLLQPWRRRAVVTRRCIDRAFSLRFPTTQAFATTPV